MLGPADDDLLPRLAGAAAVHRPQDTLALRRLLASARAYVGNDSGVSHLAAWLGAALLSWCSGRATPCAGGRSGKTSKSSGRPSTCTPCFEIASENCERPDCILEVSPADVLQALKRVIG